MSFMSSYKHLDNLCQEIYPKARNGISGYLEDMENHQGGAYMVRGWNDDYQALKHYRWVRNEISHNEYAEEENMCEPGDAEWLENFYSQIMNQTDPLAVFHQMTNPPSRSVSKSRMHKTSVQQIHPVNPQQNIPCSHQNYTYCNQPDQTQLDQRPKFTRKSSQNRYSSYDIAAIVVILITLIVAVLTGIILFLFL